MKRKLPTYLLLTMICFVTTVAGQNVLSEHDFRGNDAADDDQLRVWLNLPAGSNLNEAVIKEAAQRMLNGYRELGFLYARLDSIGIRKTTTQNAVRLIWYLFEDFPAVIGAIRLQSDSTWQEKIEEEFDLQPGEPYQETQIESEIQRINAFMARNGHPMSVVKVSDVAVNRNGNKYEVGFAINLISGPRVTIRRILIRGNTVTKEEVILRELNIQPGDIFDQELIDQIPRRLNKLGYFKSVDPVRLVQPSKTELDIIIRVEEGNTTTFDGVVGYVPPVEGEKSVEGFFTGLLQLSFRNLFGTGRKFNVYWRKPDSFSDEFNLFYEEPWLFDIPLNVGLGIERVVRDTTYIENAVALNGTFRLTTDFQAVFGLMRKTITPDSQASRDLRLSRNVLWDGKIGIEYDTRDYPLNPRSGLHYATTFSFGLKENLGPDYLLREDDLARNDDLTRIEVSMDWFQHLWAGQVLALKFYGARIESNTNRLQLSDHFWFGGSRTLRGYRENQFHGTVVSWLNVEYRFILGRDARLFVFNDWGFFQDPDAEATKEDILPGYGVGVRFATPLGIMAVDYGLGRGDTFSTGKIHFGLINEF